MAGVPQPHRTCPAVLEKRLRQTSELENDRLVPSLVDVEIEVTVGWQVRLSERLEHRVACLSLALFNNDDDDLKSLLRLHHHSHAGTLVELSVFNV